MRKLTAAIVTVATALSLFSGVAQADAVKIPAVSDWAENYVRPMAEKHLIPDSMLDEITMNQPITREQLCELVTAYVSQVNPKTVQVSNPFMDTENPSVVTAFAFGIVTGTSETQFSPGMTATREQTTAMIGRAEGFLDDRMPSLENTEERYSDGGSIERYMYSYEARSGDSNRTMD